MTRSSSLFDHQGPWLNTFSSRSLARKTFSGGHLQGSPQGPTTFQFHSNRFLDKEHFRPAVPSYLPLPPFLTAVAIFVRLQLIHADHVIERSELSFPVLLGPVVRSCLVLEDVRTSRAVSS